MAFIGDMTAEGRAVEWTCRVLREQGCLVAARTCRAWRAGGPPSARTISDAGLTELAVVTDTDGNVVARRSVDATGHLRDEYIETLPGIGSSRLNYYSDSEDTPSQSTVFQVQQCVIVTTRCGAARVDNPKATEPSSFTTSSRVWWGLLTASGATLLLRQRGPA